MILFNLLIIIDIACTVAVILICFVYAINVFVWRGTSKL